MVPQLALSWQVYLAGLGHTPLREAQTFPEGISESCARSRMVQLA